MLCVSVSSSQPAASVPPAPRAGSSCGPQTSRPHAAFWHSTGSSNQTWTTRARSAICDWKPQRRTAGYAAAGPIWSALQSTDRTDLPLADLVKDGEVAEQLVPGDKSVASPGKEGRGHRHTARGGSDVIAEVGGREPIGVEVGNGRARRDGPIVGVEVDARGRATPPANRPGNDGHGAGEDAGRRSAPHPCGVALPSR